MKVSPSRIKKKEIEEIDSQIEEFLEKGGEIESIQRGVSNIQIKGYGGVNKNLIEKSVQKGNRNSVKARDIK